MKLKIDRLTLFVAAFSVGSCPVGVAAAQAEVESSSVYSVVEVQDPFIPGSVLQINHNEVDNSARTSRSEGIQYTYGFSSGAVVGIFVPVLWASQPPGAAGASVPRIGGQGYDKIEFEGYFRFWGNATQYIGLEIGIVPPYESDPAIRNTTQDRLVFPASLLTRFGNSVFSLGFTFKDTWQLPAVTSTEKGVQLYHDEDNEFEFSTSVEFLPEGNVSPYLRWSETLNYANNTGTDRDTSAYITSIGHTAEARSFSVGVQGLPWSKRPILFGLETVYQALPQLERQSHWTWNAKVRWAL